MTNTSPGWTRLLGVYCRVLAWYVLAVAVLWVIGLEAIYGSPTPFYALFFPASGSIAWHLPFVAALLIGLGLLRWVTAAMDWDAPSWDRRTTAFLLLGLTVFAFAFPAVVAMIRDGLDGITHAYQRQTYEYVGDIGKTSNIRLLFHDYIKIHPYLSMHAKVHPPGPIALLWLLSLVFTQTPTGLSLATMLVGALAVIPLFLWVNDMADRRTAFICALLYALMPSIVLFTATSADILFTPFTIATLFLFWRAIHRNSVAYALAAGVGYGLMTLLSFSLAGIGVFFALIGLYRLKDSATRMAVVKTAIVMAAGLLAVHLAVRLWSGFDVIACFQACKNQFDTDQLHLDELSPRFPAWTFRFLNPACLFYFAGIPASVLCVWRLFRPEPNTKGLFIAFGLTLLALNFLYLARGEGERSAMYVLPFVAVPAAHLLAAFVREGKSWTPLLVSAAFLAFQCWLTESVLYTFW